MSPLLILKIKSNNVTWTFGLNAHASFNISLTLCLSLAYKLCSNNFLPLGFPLSKNKVEIHQHCLRVSSNICGFGVITFDQETLSGPLHKYTSSRSEGLSPSLSTSTLVEK